MARRNALDKVISYLSPKAAARRVRDRIVLEQMTKLSARRYEGASTGRRTDGWITSSSSANTEIQGALGRLRDRSRDLVRNDPHASRGISVIATNVVGTGITPRPFSADKNKVKVCEMLWRQWAETSACDINGQLNFYGLEKQCIRSVAEGGEVLLRRVWNKDSKLAVPMQIQLLEPDFIDSYNYSNMVLPNGNHVKQGIEFTPQGKRVAFYIWENHPGEMSVPFNAYKSIRVPAEDIAQGYRIDRIGQIRGVPWAAPVITKIRDFNDYDDAQLLRQKIAACYSAFIYDSEGADTPMNDDGSPLVDKFEAGMIEILPPGKDIKFGNPPSVDGYTDFSRGHLRAIAAGLDISYESLTGDYSQVNYSSGRMGQLQFQNNIRDWQWNMFIPMICDRVWLWFLEAISISNRNFYDVGARWTTPRIPMLDPTKELAAKKVEIRSGLISLPEAIRENGNDPDEMFAEIAATNKKLDDLEIVLDTDPRYVTEFGMEQPSLYTGGGSGQSNDSTTTEEKQ